MSNAIADAGLCSLLPFTPSARRSRQKPRTQVPFSAIVATPARVFFQAEIAGDAAARSGRTTKRETRLGRGAAAGAIPEFGTSGRA